MFEEDEEITVDPHNLKVDILVRAGQHHAVEFTTVIAVDITNAKEAANQIRDVVEILRKALPLTEIKNEDREHFFEQTEIVSGVNGKVHIVPLGSVKAERALERLRSEMPPPEKKETNGETELPKRSGT